jgi:beta-phosphoglucomutase-like phosphatase (HAD superfamily)
VTPPHNLVAMSPFDLVIFDCDGVLVDSERLAVRTEAEILTGLGWVRSGHGQEGEHPGGRRNGKSASVVVPILRDDGTVE